MPFVSANQQCTKPHRDDGFVCPKVKGTVKEPNTFHNYETEKITRKTSDVTDYIELFGSSTRDRHARRISYYSLNVRRYMRRA